MKALKAFMILGLLAALGGVLYLRNRSIEEKFVGARVMRLFFSPDGQRVYGGGVTVSGPKQVQGNTWAWETKTGRLLWKTTSNEEEYPNQLSSDGATLLVMRRLANPQLWDTATGKVRCELKMDPQQGDMRRAYFTPDGKRVMTCFFKKGIQVWDTTTGNRLAFWPYPKGKEGWQRQLQFSADGKKMLVGPTAWYDEMKDGENSTDFVQLQDTQDGHVLKKFAGNACVFAISPKGDSLAMRTNSRGPARIFLYDANTGAQQALSPKFPLYFDLESLEFQPDGNLLCIGRNSEFSLKRRPQWLLWDIHANRMIEQPAVSTDYDQALSSDRQLKAAANHGGYWNRPPLATLYEASTGKKRCDLEGLAGR